MKRSWVLCKEVRDSHKPDPDNSMPTLRNKHTHCLPSYQARRMSENNTESNSTRQGSVLDTSESFLLICESTHTKIGALSKRGDAVCTTAASDNSTKQSNEATAKYQKAYMLEQTVQPCGLAEQVQPCQSAASKQTLSALLNSMSIQAAVHASNSFKTSRQSKRSDSCDIDQNDIIRFTGEYQSSRVRYAALPWHSAHDCQHQHCSTALHPQPHQQRQRPSAAY